ncbi:hypothetical protein BC940DRAFT_332086 [Gongronella butleri]|nr:hypothetical protein BC940DRAFT_332086 [Gongronella butleri]
MTEQPTFQSDTPLSHAQQEEQAIPSMAPVAAPSDMKHTVDDTDAATKKLARSADAPETGTSTPPTDASAAMEQPEQPQDEEKQQGQAQDASWLANDALATLADAGASTTPLSVPERVSASESVATVGVTNNAMPSETAASPFHAQEATPATDISNEEAQGVVDDEDVNMEGSMAMDISQPAAPMTMDMSLSGTMDMSQADEDEENAMDTSATMDMSYPATLNDAMDTSSTMDMSQPTQDDHMSLAGTMDMSLPMESTVETSQPAANAAANAAASIMEQFASVSSSNDRNVHPHSQLPATTQASASEPHTSLPITTTATTTVAPDASETETFEIVEHEGSSPKPLLVNNNGAAHRALAAPKKPSRTPSPFTSITKDQLKYCMAIIRNLKKHRDATPFIHPVDYVKLNIPDYPKIIQNPIDLTTIEQRLHANAYHQVSDFVADIRLLFNNCYKFNGPEAMVSMLCQNVESAFEKSLRQMPPNKSASSASSPDRRLDEGRPKREIHPPASKDYPEQLARSSISGASAPGRRVKLDKQMRFCNAVLRELKKTKYRDLSYPFLQPVDYVALNIPDYPQIITHPMDISTIEQKLNQGDYESPDDFESDIRLMFNNCYRYNPPALPIHKMAQQLEAVFDEKWKELPEREPTPAPASPPPPPPAPHVITRRASNYVTSEDESMSENDDDAEQDQRIAELERHIASISQQIASIKSQKRKSTKSGKRVGGNTSSSSGGGAAAKRKAKDTSAAATKRRPRSASTGAPKRRRTSSAAATGAPAELPEFTFEQKKDLSERINNLSGDKLNTVVTIIQNSMPHLDGQGQEEIVLDIDALDRKTLHQLHEFVTGTSLIPKRPAAMPRSSSSSAAGTAAGGAAASRPQAASRSHSTGATSLASAAKPSKKKVENDRRIQALEDAIKQISRHQHPAANDSSSDSDSSSGSDSDSSDSD